MNHFYLLNVFLLTITLNVVVAIQPTRDEFNSTEILPIDFTSSRESSLQINDETINFPRNSFKRILLRLNYSDCCPSWDYLTTNNSEVLEELNGQKGKLRNKELKVTLKPVNLLQEYKKTFLNITYLSIEGQSGSSERQKYYNFFDTLQYFLRLSKLARDFIVKEQTNQLVKLETDVEFLRDFNRELRSVEFKITTDPTLSSFLSEFMSFNNNNNATGSVAQPVTMNPNFLYYEDFLTKTTFGQYYAQNISLIRESVFNFEQIYSFLTNSDSILTNNLTRPSEQYRTMKTMASELYSIKRKLEEEISVRIRSNRQDVRSLFAKLRQLEAAKPYIRMLGDIYTTTNNFGYYSKKLANLLDLYLFNNMTRVTFYQGLSELPEDFILLGANIAAEYENREVPPLLKINQTQLQQFQQLNYQVQLQDNNQNKEQPSTAPRVSSDSSWVGMISSPVVYINRKLNNN